MADLDGIVPGSDSLVDRRGFLTVAGAAAIGSLLSGCGGGSDAATGPGAPPFTGTPSLPEGVQLNGGVLQVDLTRVTALQPANGFLILSQPATIVVHLGNEDFRAFTAVCTHSGCLVGSFSGGRIRCPCHGSEFDVQGAVANGPATRALRSFPVSFDAITRVLRVTTT